jgi:hypothetical protein
MALLNPTHHSHGHGAMAAPGAGEVTPDGEAVLMRATLNPKWSTWRACSCCCTCTLVGLSFGLPIFGLPYLCCGGTCRQSEADSFSMVLTPTAVQYKQVRANRVVWRALRCGVPCGVACPAVWRAL